MRFRFLALALCVGALNLSAQEITSSTLGVMKGRHIGPARTSGRIAAIDALHSDHNVVWVGASGGGVWKSLNQGTTFKQVFDDHSQNIGAICIDQKHPDTVWVGTGESWTRNSTGIGTGIYKTTNGGRKWKHMGLGNSERIARIIVHPGNSDRVYVAVTGALWGDSEERGVYRSNDGGESWERILYRNPSTGCADLVIDPNNSDVLYAAIWDFRRTAYDFRSGGPGSGLFRSRDGGDTWEELRNGLPEGELGRIAISASPVSPNYLYALVESEKSALYRSADGGDTWEIRSEQIQMGERPFYFSNILADPVDSNRVFKPGNITLMSTDGGATFASVAVEGGAYHVDHHALWVSPTDNRVMYVGTDGGVYVSVDRGNTWRHAQNLPVAQFYEISLDMNEPYNIYGGLQDNGSWTAPSRNPGGIQSADWETVGYGDGFHCYADREDPDIVYWQYQGGRIYRTDRTTGDSKFIKPFPDEESGDLRFNWNAPVIFSKTNNTLYVGAQYLYRSRDRGDSWERISPDLTTNDPNRQKQEESGGLTIDNSTAENNTTIISIAESPLNEKVIWAGTDDGNLWVTRDGGKKWDLMNERLPGMPPLAFISHIDAGNFDEGVAFVSIDAHRNGDMTPYVYMTDNHGETWISITSDQVEGYCYVIKQDIVNPELLFLGTEFGLYVSIDRGKNWVRFENEVPKVAVHDLQIHPRDHDLVLGTHGRGVIIIDDITPLRNLTVSILDEELAFLPARDYVFPAGGVTQDFPGDQEFVGRNPSSSPSVYYYMAKRHIFGEMFIELYDGNGNFIKQQPAGKRKGLNRVPLDITMRPPRVPISVNPVFGAAFGPSYGAGTYMVKVVKGDTSFTTEVTLNENPAYGYTAEERSFRREVQMRAYNMLEELAFIDANTVEIMNQADSLRGVIKNSAVQAMSSELFYAADALHKEVVATQAGEGAIVGQVRLREKIVEVYSAIGSFQGPPNSSQVMALDVYEAKMEVIREKLDKMIAERVEPINEFCAQKKIRTIELVNMDDFFAED
jgi:photosystem II stability/assembly factor-like uncharacterized protein